MRQFLRQLIKKFLHSPLFFMDRIQIIFALLLVGIVFTIAFLTFSQLNNPKSSTITPTQVPQGVITPKPNVPLNIQPTKAVVLIENLKEVQDAKSTATTSSNKFVTEIDSYPTSQNYFYFIHAYEVVSDGNGNTHTATVGWYKVDPQTGKVTKSDGI